MTFEHFKKVLDEFYARAKPDCKGAEVCVNLGHSVLPFNEVAFFPIENRFVIIADIKQPGKAAKAVG